MTVPWADVEQHGRGQVEGLWRAYQGWAARPYLSAVAVARQALPSQAQ